MKQNFWKKLIKPIVGLSPMDGVTDQPFRHIHKKYGKPSVVYTEFTNVEGVCHGAKRLLRDFIYDKSQHPIVAQIYGTTPEFFRQTAVILCQLGFDGIDINMGCPAKNVASSGAGATLIKTPKLAQDIITATKAGVQDWANGMEAKDCSYITKKITDEIERRQKLLEKNPNLENDSTTNTRNLIPVSVKTRIGYSVSQVEEWIQILLEPDPDLIAIHGRTLRQGYSGRADWDEIGKAVELVKNIEKNTDKNTLILGNGDVGSYNQALEKTKKYGVDGVLIGRASFGNPFVFDPNYDADLIAFYNNMSHEKITDLKKKIYAVAIEHAELFEKTYQDDEKYSFLPMRKHLGWYMRGIPNAKELKIKLFQANSSKDVRAILYVK